jgi:SPP1 gp7 family putative phage head morphogenesis protein
MLPIVQTHDIRVSSRSARRLREHFAKVRNAELSYVSQLKKIARHIGDLVKSLFTGDISIIPEITRSLEHYGTVIRPWASSVSARMLAEVNRREETAWKRAAQDIHVNLVKEIRNAPTGVMMRKLHNDQVNLITSLPLEAAQRVQQLAQDYVAGGKRYDEMVEMILQSGNVVKSRAVTIARTETAKAQSSLTQARSEYIGSDSYRWRAVGDYRTREMHKKLNGTIQRFDNPPIAEKNGARHHPGMFPNCFPGNVIVDVSQAIQLFRVFYQGKLVCLKSRGEVVELTPNHPMLTRRGWVPADLLNSSDEIACLPLERDYIGNNSKNECITTFGDFFESFGIHAAESIPSILFDFYGDVFDGDVDKIVINPELLFYFNVILSEEISKFSFSCPDSWIVTLFIFNIINQIPCTSETSIFDSIQMLLRCFPGCDEFISTLLSACINICFFQSRLNNKIGDSEVFSNARNPHTAFVHSNNFLNWNFYSPPFAATLLSNRSIYSKGTKLLTEHIGVAADGMRSLADQDPVPYHFCRLQDKYFRDFSGHVYTLETTTGQYSVGASRFQAKNCRCWIEPILPDNL